MRLFPVFKPIALLMILAVMAALTGETALAQNDAWYDHSVQTFTGNKNLSAAAEVYLSGQPTMIRMEYFEYTGD